MPLYHRETLSVGLLESLHEPWSQEITGLDLEEMEPGCQYQSEEQGTAAVTMCDDSEPHTWRYTDDGKGAGKQSL